MEVTQDNSILIIKYNLWISVVFKRLVSDAPYLIHDTTMTPNITGRGVLPIENGLVQYLIS